MILYSIDNDSGLLSPKYTVEAQPIWNNAVSISPDSKYVVTAENDKTVKLWEIEDHKQLKRVATYKHDTNISTLLFGSLRGEESILFFDEEGHAVHLKVENRIDNPNLDIKALGIDAEILDKALPPSNIGDLPEGSKK